MNDKIVTVIIATFNSSKYVLETLESISKQSWEGIELIITDDNSEDDTVEICLKWLNENKKRFVNAVLIRSDRNTGVSANANRGLAASKGHWIKLLGADDCLKPDCIFDNMQWVEAHPEVKILFSQIEVYRDSFAPENLLRTIPGIPLDQNDVLAPGRSADSQYRMLLLCDRINFSPSVFMSRETLLSIGGFDERFRMLEDYPLWLNLTRYGCKLHFMEGVTVKYRQHSGAINNTGMNYLINPNYFGLENFRKLYTYPFLPLDVRINQRYCWYASQIFRANRLNRNTKMNRFMLNLIMVYLNPFKYFIFLKKRLYTNLKESEFYN